MVKRVKLAPKLDTAASGALKQALEEVQGHDLVLDAAEVEILGALCLETLMSAGVLWRLAGHTISIENTSSQMVDDLSRFGLCPDTLLEYAA
ncbi:MAG: STAS domain-containing protein [Pseudomonadota bacterium]